VGSVRGRLPRLALPKNPVTIAPDLFSTPKPLKLLPFPQPPVRDVTSPILGPPLSLNHLAAVSCFENIR
jgi:hypothetical protein